MSKKGVIFNLNDYRLWQKSVTTVTTLKILTTITTMGAHGAARIRKIPEKCEKSPENHWISGDGLHNMENHRAPGSGNYIGKI